MLIPVLPFVATARDAHVATDLLARLGAGAAGEAATLADAARRIGNHLDFCRWRQVERLVHWLAIDAAPGTLH